VTVYFLGKRDFGLAFCLFDYSALRVKSEHLDLLVFHNFLDKRDFWFGFCRFDFAAL